MPDWRGTELLETSGYLAIREHIPESALTESQSPCWGLTLRGVILAASLFGILTYGGSNMQFVERVPFEVVRVVFAAIILFVAANIAVGAFRSSGKKAVKENA